MKAHGAGLEEELGIKMPIQSNSKGGGLSKTRFEGLGDAHRNGLVTSCLKGCESFGSVSFRQWLWLDFWPNSSVLCRVRVRMVSSKYRQPKAVAECMEGQRGRVGRCFTSNQRHL